MPQPVTLKKLKLNSSMKTQKRCPFHYKGLECKSRKSRATWNDRQIWPWSTKQSRSKANRVLPRERTGHSKHSLPTTQEKTLHMDITRWSAPNSDWLYSSPSLAAKNIINLISVLTIRWRPCVESSLVLLEESVCSDQCVFLVKLY